MQFKVAVVTPYYKETAAILKKCHDSVLGQTYPCDHIVVSDGHKNEFFEHKGRALHVTLPRAHGDNGNTPRGIGSMLADTYGYDVVAYLDADNWFAPEHISNAVAAHEASGHPVVCCKRTFHDMEGAPLPIIEPAEESRSHVDTSCFVIFRPAFSAFRAWSMPKELGPICDRILLHRILRDRFPIHWLEDRTVAFRTQYAYHYRLAGLPIPSGSKNNEDIALSIGYLMTKENINTIFDRLGYYPDFDVWAE